VSYEAPDHLVVVNHSTLADDKSVALWTEAVRLQLRDAAEAWELPAPGCFFYGHRTDIPPDEGCVIGIVDDDGNADSAGYHTAIGKLAFGLVDMGQSNVPSRTLSHEALEMLGNVWLDRWMPGPKGRLYAAELADACQRDEYTIQVDLFGVTSQVRVSDFILPGWFDEASLGKYDYLGLLHAPFTNRPGGYHIALDGDEVLYVAHPEGMAQHGARIKPLSRTARLMGRRP